MDYINAISNDLRALGIRSGDVILVHSSLRSLGFVPGGPETVIRGLLAAVGEEGTLLLPALSYRQQPHHIHDNRRSPSNVGAIPEHFRLREGTKRSLHPTHSICGVDPAVDSLFRDHPLDTTPCGPHSPLNRMIDLGAKIIMLGCSLRPNTTMHALEEYVVPPYLFGPECEYTITDADGRTYRKVYTRHGFQGWAQRYDRVRELPRTDFLTAGHVLEAETFVLETQPLREAVLARMRENPLFFVDRVAA